MVNRQLGARVSEGPGLPPHFTVDYAREEAKFLRPSKWEEPWFVVNGEEYLRSVDLKIARCLCRADGKTFISPQVVMLPTRRARESKESSWVAAFQFLIAGLKNYLISIGTCIPKVTYFHLNVHVV